MDAAADLGSTAAAGSATAYGVDSIGVKIAGIFKTFTSPQHSVTDKNTQSSESLTS